MVPIDLALGVAKAASAGIQLSRASPYIWLAHTIPINIFVDTNTSIATIELT